MVLIGRVAARASAADVKSGASDKFAAFGMI
jgi:hypothetical protein